MLPIYNGDDILELVNGVVARNDSANYFFILTNKVNFTFLVKTSISRYFYCFSIVSQSTFYLRLSVD